MHTLSKAERTSNNIKKKVCGLFRPHMFPSFFLLDGLFQFLVTDDLQHTVFQVRLGL